jgi:hypothetical protein
VGQPIERFIPLPAAATVTVSDQELTELATYDEAIASSVAEQWRLRGDLEHGHAWHLRVGLQASWEEDCGV